MFDEESNHIVVKNCGESSRSFQESVFWRDGRRIAQFGLLAEALGKCCAEGCSSTLNLRNT